ALLLAWLVRYDTFLVPWRPDKRVFSDVYWRLMIGFLAITMLAVFVEVLFFLGHLADGQWDKDVKTMHTGQAPVRDGNVVSVSGEYFVWNFLDAVPLLKVTETLNWKLERSFDD